MIALVSLPTAVEIALALLACMGFFLLLAWLERRRPLTAEEKAETNEDLEDAWAGIDEARKRWEEQHEIASFETEASPERIISTRRAA